MSYQVKLNFFYFNIFNNLYWYYFLLREVLEEIHDDWFRHVLPTSPSGVLGVHYGTDSDISFSWDSVSDLTLVTDTINIIPLSLSWSISDSISISYQLQSNPSWITIDIDKREIIANTVGIPVGTTATFTINSISNYPIWDKTVNLKIVSWSVQNWKVCNSNNPNSWQTCSDWYTTKQDASSNTVWIEYSSISGSISSISSTTTQSMIGAVAGTSILFSFCNLSTFQGIWITVNQFQLILLLLLTNSHIPKSIVSYLSGLKETTCSLNFIPFKKVYGFKWITDWLDFHIENSYIECLNFNLKGIKFSFADSRFHGFIRTYLNKIIKPHKYPTTV